MKRISVKLISAFLAGATGLISFSGLSVPICISADTTYEYAEFPLRTMCVTQLAFEDGKTGSHKNSYHIDCSGKYEEFAVAPFTGKVVYATDNYGLVLFQSCDPVYYADGSLDYMTVIFMHCANTDELGKLRTAGTVVPQGDDLVRCGGIGKNGEEEYVKHYDIGVHRGQLSTPNDDPAAGGYYSRLGNIYPFEGLYVNPELTVNIVNWGKLASGNQLTKGSYADWKNCWVLLGQDAPAAAVTTTAPAATTAPVTTAAPAATTSTVTSAADKLTPEKPLVSVSSDDQVVISYQECENTTYYNVRVYNSTSRQVAYCVGVCEDANAFNECRMFTDTSLSQVFAPGSYYVRVTAVNKADGTVAASDAVPFEVELPEFAGSGDLDGNAIVNAADISLMMRCIGGNDDLKPAVMQAADMNFDGVLNAADLTVLKRIVMQAAA